MASHLSHMAIRRTVIGILTVGAVVTATTGAASADLVQTLGTNGQQVRACDDQAFYTAVKITGTSQSGTTASTTGYLDPVDSCHSFTGWWFHGTVTLKWFRDGSSKTKTTYCNVPKVLPENWVLCVNPA
ncbi:hypothetical protein ACFQVD_36365 [Streptosporangium amethystogenes subsp. fukuiense]|uniref:Secreted protein n=1 Tax=Streptosporangium amethystogenes subsp. fukuiense TaxID=698418 RepID=A0ABW2TCV6_9ACTN